MKKQTSCNDRNEQGLMSVDQALSHILNSVQVVSGEVFIPIEQACRHCLAVDVFANFNVPAYHNSAVDGYAIFDEDIPQQGVKKLKIMGQALAGTPYQGQLVAGQCIHIMTGAILPQEMKTVVMQEHVEVNHNSLLLETHHQSGEHVRLAGEDLRQGEKILNAGKYLTPPDIGVLASLGLTEIKVKRQLRIALISSGDEVFALGERRSASGLYDSNRYSLRAALMRPDIEIIDLGIVDDDPQILLTTFQAIANEVDLIISTGGVSVGVADYTKSALQALGSIDFWKIAIKPGRPLAFGQLHSATFFGLPGNPVAVMVTFYQFVLPALDKMLGIINKPIAPIFKACALETIPKREGRTEVQRGILTRNHQEEWTVKTTGKQGSGILHSMSLANAFIILEHSRGQINTGEFINVQPFSGLF